VSERRVVVVGDVMLDVVVRPTQPLAPTSDTPATVRLGRGGAGANLAVVVANAGHDVTFVGASGDDVPAQMFRDALATAGVRCELLRVESPTGVVVALVSRDGQRAMMTDRGANRRLSVEHVLGQLEESFDHLHVSGYTLLDAATRDVGIAALHFASDTDRTTSVDACSVGPLSEVTPTVFLEAARGATMVFANEEEALLLSGAADVDGATIALSRLFSEVVVTRGARGALARKGEICFEVPARARTVLDTTGAGDAATGAYLAARLHDESMSDALDAAMEAASVVVRGLGSSG
jgi:ribokinase